MQNTVYCHINELPQDVKDYLPLAEQQLFLETYNQFRMKGCDWGSAFQLAWASLELNEQ